METILLIICIVLAFLIFSYLLVNFLIVPIIISRKICLHYMTRKSTKEWGHRCSDETNYEQRIMWDEGLTWAKENEKYSEKLHIVSEGYNLYGEYFDFGKEKTVIIIPGRTESYSYSYFYAPAYQKAGYNVLVIDKRAHGYSDGLVGEIGKKSSKDIIAWAKTLHEKFHMNDISLHGICIGSSICLYTVIDPECPNYIKRLVSDGMFTTFYVSFYRHMQEQQRPLFPYCRFVMKWGKKYSGEEYIHDGPIYEIQKVKIPCLFLFTELDKYTLHKDALALYQKCGASKKKIVFFDKGLHSHVRINNPEKYDQAIEDFTKETL